MSVRKSNKKSIILTRKGSGWYTTNVVVTENEYSSPVEITKSMDRKDSWLVTGIREDFISKKDAVDCVLEALKYRNGVYNDVTFSIKYEN